ncbi:MAG: DUF4864 domain-containing protein [Verrucomicrobiales bacterium]
MPFCANCGVNVHSGDKFCPSCGHPLEHASPRVEVSGTSGTRLPVESPQASRPTSPAGGTAGRQKLSGCALAGIVGGSLVLLCVLGLGIVIALSFSLTSGAVDAIEDHFQMLKHGEIEKAYQNTSAGFRSVISWQQYQTFVSSYPVLRDVASSSFEERSIENGVATLGGLVTDSSGRQSPFRARLVKEGGLWKVMAVELTGQVPVIPQGGVNPPTQTSPPVPPRTETEAWQSLFDGRTLEGWQAGESPESFKVENGAIVAEGRRSHLYYTGPVQRGTFTNFEFSAEVMTFPGANSGVYFHTRWQPEGFPLAGQYPDQQHGSSGDSAIGQTFQKWRLVGIVDHPVAVVGTINGSPCPSVSLGSGSKPVSMDRSSLITQNPMTWSARPTLRDVSCRVARLPCKPGGSTTLYRSIQVRQLP